MYLNAFSSIISVIIIVVIVIIIIIKIIIIIIPLKEGALLRLCHVLVLP